MQMKVLALGAYQTNCYILWEEDRNDCIVIDPGYHGEIILSAVKELGKELCAVLLTHGHFDHVGAVRELVQETDCRVYIHKKEFSLPDTMTSGKLYHTHLYRKQVQEAGITLNVMHTPGHSPGSVCLLGDGIIFSGDTLFAKSCGRTDFIGGSQPKLFQSIQKLARLPGNATVYPGHGDATTLDEERKYNPYMG